jgi:hypothetical protein
MACATVLEEILPLLPPGMQNRTFDFGLHVNPALLHQKLQAAIDEAGSDFTTVLLGYGLCSKALLGIIANHCAVVAPRVDDCIALFLGSAAQYRNHLNQEPGTYYLTKGWIEVGDTPFSEFKRVEQKYGSEKARMVYATMMGSYKRLALINTGLAGMEKYRNYSRRVAAEFGLEFEEVAGSTALILKMLHGDWDGDFIVLKPGEAFTLDHFMCMLEAQK